LFSAETGVGFGTLAIDALHTLNLGLFQKLVAKVLWTLLLRNAWGVAAASGGRMNQEELVGNGCLRLRADLWAWYAEQERANPGERLARLSDLSVKTLGDAAAVCTRTKAAETRPLVHFCAWLVGRYREALPPDNPALAPAAVALSDFATMLRQVPRVLGPEHVQALHDGLKRYVALAIRAGIPLTPKVHLAMHLVHRSAPYTGLAPAPSLTPGAAARRASRMGDRALGQAPSLGCSRAPRAQSEERRHGRPAVLRDLSG
jgi:hypothetical protein